MSMVQRVAQVTATAAALVALGVVLMLLIKDSEGSGHAGHQPRLVLQMLLIHAAAAAVAAIFRRPALMIVFSLALVFPYGLYFLGSPAFPMFFGVASIVYGAASVSIAVHAFRTRT